MILTQAQINEMRTLAAPLVKFLNENGNPHTEIVVDQVSVKILDGVARCPIVEYVKD